LVWFRHHLFTKDLQLAISNSPASRRARKGSLKVWLAIDTSFYFRKQFKNVAYCSCLRFEPACRTFEGARKRFSSERAIQSGLPQVQRSDQRRSKKCSILCKPCSLEFGNERVSFTFCPSSRVSRILGSRFMDAAHDAKKVRPCQSSTPAYPPIFLGNGT